MDTIFDYLATTRQLSSSWLSLLLVTHLRTFDLHACPSFVTSSLFDKLILRCQVREQTSLSALLVAMEIPRESRV